MMMNKFGVLVVAGFLAAGCFAEMFGGTIAFKDGGTVEFVRMGDGSPAEYTLFGKLGEQRVEYKFNDLGQIIFSGGKFDNANGEAVVVSKAGKRFSISNCTVSGKSPRWKYANSSLLYRYLDPITNQEQDGKEPPEKIASITIGAAQGDVKKSPTTGEYFPSMYNFDPFTGEKLEWAKRAE
jgi:hypothetical protein